MIKRQVLPPWQAIHLPAFGTQKPAFKHIITYTGFENEERIRVREMIEETGAKVYIVSMLLLFSNLIFILILLLFFLP